MGVIVGRGLEDGSFPFFATFWTLSVASQADESTRDVERPNDPDGGFKTATAVAGSGGGGSHSRKNNRRG